MKKLRTSKSGTKVFILEYRSLGHKGPHEKVVRKQSKIDQSTFR